MTSRIRFWPGFWLHLHVRQRLGDAIISKNPWFEAIVELRELVEFVLASNSSSQGFEC